MPFEQRADQVARRTREGFLGQWAWDSHLKRYNSGINRNPQRVEVWNATVNTDPGDSQAFVIRFTFADFVYDFSSTTGTGLDAAGIAGKIVTEINENSILRGQIVASRASAVLTFTGLNVGQSFVVTAPTNPSTMLASITEATASQTAADIEVARAVCITGQNESDAGTEPEYLVALAASGLFSAQVITWTPTYVASARYGVAIYEVRGSEGILLARSEVVGATDLNATLDALADNLNALLAANTVLVASAPATATTMTFTAEIAGLEIDVEVSVSGDGASMPTSAVAYTTGPSPSTSLQRAFGGVALYTLAYEAASIGGTVARYPGNHGVVFGTEGMVYVENSEATRPARGEAVFVELGSKNTGKLFRAGSSTRVALPRNRAAWERSGRSTDNLNLAVVRLGPGY
jgi:hypothetical protein